MMSTKNMQIRKITNMYNKLATVPFPFQLYQLLEDMAQNAWNESIVSWLPHGKAFRVHQPKEFADKIMPQYFKQTKYKSFQRQLHLYGFIRINSGLDVGGYYHKLFIKENVSLCFKMKRCKIKGTKGKQHLKNTKVDDPNFYIDNIPNMKNEGIGLECKRTFNRSWSQYNGPKSYETNYQWIPKSTNMLYGMVFNHTVGNEYSIKQGKWLQHWKKEKMGHVYSTSSSQDDDDDCLSSCSISIQQEEENFVNDFFKGEESSFEGRKFFTVETDVSLIAYDK